MWVRMVVDACYPTDIREETDVEFYCRLLLPFIMPRVFLCMLLSICLCMFLLV